MWCKAVRALLPVAAACLFVLSSSSAARAGGFGLAVEVPVPAEGQAAQPNDPVLLVHAIGCHGPGSMVAGKAEGIVNGKRVTIPLRLDALGEDRYALKRQWPQGKQGWVISLSAKSAHLIGTGKRRYRPVTHALVEIAADGNIPLANRITVPDTGEVRQVAGVNYVGTNDKKAAIDAALRRLAVRRTDSRKVGAASGDKPL